MPQLSFWVCLAVSVRFTLPWERRPAAPGDSDVTHRCRRTCWQHWHCPRWGQRSAALDTGNVPNSSVCCSMVLWWQDPGRAKGALRAERMATGPHRAKQTRCLSWPCFSSMGLTLVHAGWLYPQGSVSCSALSRQAVPWPSHPSWQVEYGFSPAGGWAMEMRNDGLQSSTHSGFSPFIIIAFPEKTFHKLDPMILGVLLGPN